MPGKNEIVAGIRLEGEKEFRQEITSVNKSIAASRSELKKTEVAYRKIRNKVSDWQTKLNTAETQLEKANRATKKNAAYLDEASKSVDGCATSIDKFGKSVEKSSTFKDMISANLIGDALEGGIRLIGNAAKEAAEYVVEVGSEFEAGMSEVTAISGATGQELDSMSAKAKELGASTKFSTTEVASAFKYMSLAGWSTQQLDGIDGVLNLAAASGMELADASDMVTDYLSAFGMQASESAKMADMLAFAQANSNTTAQQWEMHTETALLSFIQADRI